MMRTLLASAIKTPMPSVQQHVNYSCGPTTLHSVGAHHGVASPDHSVTAAMCAADPEHGTTPKTLVRVAKRLGLKATIVHNMTDEQLRRTIDAHKSCILNIRAYGDGHYVAAVGYDRLCLYVMDSMIDGYYGFIPWKELGRRWWDDDQGTRSDRLAIVFRRRRSAWSLRAVWVKA